MLIRAEKKEDIDDIRMINSAAFETGDEARMVDQIRESGISYISLVAEMDRKLVGHILFTPVIPEDHTVNTAIAGLAPMAVLPQYQNQGFGSKLVREGLKRCEDAGYEAVVVLGHPEYYPRFGFMPAVKFGIWSEYEVPDDVFMALELKQGAMKKCAGLVRYHEIFR
ncbi:MAG: GNAT family N-acetyltransferase [Calditrichaceae bacterium]